jgi:hypothetical protein
MRSTAIIFLFGLALACFTFSGCDQAKQTKNGKDVASHDGDGHDHAAGDHDHDHDHDHDAAGDVHGPNGGHLFEFADGDYHGEWKHFNDNFVIKVFILDKEGKKNQAVAAESVTIKPTAGDETAEFSLDPDSPDDDGNAFSYSLDSQDLSIAMNLGVVVEMKLGGKTYTAKIPAHAPHDH